MGTREASALVHGLPGKKEAGLPAYNFEFWYGMSAPAGTRPAVADRICEAALNATREPPVREVLARQGAGVSTSASRDRLDAFLEEDGKL